MEPIRLTASIDGHRYDTATAVLLADDAYWDGHSSERHGRNQFLFRTQLRGLYFVLRRSLLPEEEDCLIPLNRDEAMALWSALPHRNMEVRDAFPSSVGVAAALKPVHTERSAAAAPVASPELPPDPATASTSRLPVPARDDLAEGVTLDPEAARQRYRPRAGARALEAGGPSVEVAGKEVSPSASTAVEQQQAAPRPPDATLSHFSAPPGVSKPQLKGPRSRVASEAAPGPVLPEPAPPGLEHEVPTGAAGTPAVEGADEAPSSSEVSPAEREGPAGPSVSAAGALDTGELWLDEQGEWQVAGVVRHRTGRLRLVEDRLVVTTNGVAGRFKKTPWSREDELAASEVLEIRVGRGRAPSVRIVPREAGAPVIELLACRPAVTLEALLSELQRIGPEIVVRGLP